MESNENVKWYIIHTYASYESVAKSNLEKMIENNNLQDYIFEISIPTEEDIVEKNGKRKVVEHKKFPGYVFLQDDIYQPCMVNDYQYKGGYRLCRAMGKALPLTADEIKRMGLEKVSAEDFNISVGDNVRIINGPLETFIA